MERKETPETMSEITPRRRHRALAAATALALGTLGVVATGPAASAANIDQSRQGAITIHKYANPGNGAANPDGSGTQPTTDPIAGVVFEYCRIDGVDLFDGTNTGWDALTAITAQQKTDAAGQGTATLGSHTLSGCATVTTGSDGVASTGTLPLGPYFVREVQAPANVVEKSVPFIVTVPTPATPAALNGQWVYDVNVYPKNTVAEGPSKNIVGQPANGSALGAPITYQVTTAIPALGAGETYDTFIVTDTLDTKLTPAADLSTVSVAVPGGTTFAQGADYTPVWAGQTLTVTFTAAGLARLQAGANVVVTFQAAANAVGDIVNQAYVNLNGFQLTPGTPNGPGGSPTGQVTTRWGTLVVEKVNAANTSEGLAGARFEIYQGTTDTTGCKADIASLTAVTAPGTTTPLVVQSASDGAVTFDGLWVGDTQFQVAADGTVTNVTEDGHDFTQRCYVLKEVAAPAGFVLPTGDAALTEVLVHSGDNGATPLVRIDNTQQGVPALPFTGSTGQLLLTGGGIALILLAIGGVLFGRARARANARRDAA
jgi:fimbrial isopeptide formation D2 family protein